MNATYDIVVPTVGRPSLEHLLDALAEGGLPRIFVVLDADREGPRRERVEVLRGLGAGPAAARNVGWRASDAEWVVFMDDDVVPMPDWLSALERDLDSLPRDVAASQGRVRVPLTARRRPTDWERNVKGLETARWATADLAVRRTALAAVGGFDERFPRAYREDADLGLRLTAAGYRILRGRRDVVHPVRAEGPFVSVRLQAGNADDALMDALHGSGWHERAGAGVGRRPLHLATSALVTAGLMLFPVRRRAGLAALGAWFGATLEFAWRRIAPGPRSAREIATVAATSIAIPPTASVHWLAGRLRARRLPARTHPRAVLLDRDGTLIVDVPYIGDPDRVVPTPGARAALDRLRGAGLPLAVISNQSGVARGLITEEHVDKVAARVEDLLGPLGPWLVCPHGPDDGCRCRKPAPGLVLQAAAALGVSPADCVVIGDVGSDVEAAKAAGARAILVPTKATRREEIDAAPEVAPDLERAVDLVLGAIA